jgi:DNA polymerase/3'-5' exonuclease PolX
VMKKVREYLMTKTCEKITAFKEDPLRVAVKDLTRIWGVGEKKAHTLARDGITNIDEVRKSLESGRLELSKNALLGVRYYEDLNEKMDRLEVDEITSIVLNVCRNIPGLKDVVITNQGSYRRGDEKCGDADLLLVHPKYVDQLPRGGLGTIINKLEEQGHVSLRYCMCGRFCALLAFVFGPSIHCRFLSHPLQPFILSPTLITNVDNPDRSSPQYSGRNVKRYQETIN